MTQDYQPCTLHQISEHVWWYVPEDRTDRPSLGAVVGTDRVLLLDAGASVSHTQAFLAELATQGIASPDYVALTHWHWDHIFGIDALACPIIAHRETAENIQRMMTLDYRDDNLLNLVAEGHEVAFTREHMMLELSNAQRADLTLRVPDITFDKTLTLNLGGVTCILEHVGGDHASDAVVFHVPEDALLFLGDCFYYTVYQLPQHFTQEKILPLVDRLEAFDADLFVFGHADELYTKADMQTEFALIRDAYRLLDKYSAKRIQAVKIDLKQHYDPDDINYYLKSIIAGLNLAP